MSQQPKNPGSSGLESWRDEIAAFVRQTIHVLHELIGAFDECEASTATTPTEEIRRILPHRPAVAASPPAPRDLDASQDRLANLKRELAAKLSNAAKDENRGQPTGD